MSAFDRCVQCGRAESEHHRFEAYAMPAGCKCDPHSWGSHVKSICPAFVSGRHDQCGNCEHDEACHTAQK